MQSVNPFSGKIIQTYREYSTPEIETIALQVDAAYRQWKLTSFGQRAQLMKNLQSKLTENRVSLAALVSAEMGKVLREALGEIDKCAMCCGFYAENAESFLKNEAVKTEAAEAYISFQPIGTILAVMPWNFPFWQVFRFLAPALMAGNTGF